MKTATQTRKRKTKRYRVVIIERPKGFHPKHWEDVPTCAVKVIGCKSAKNRAGAEGYLYGFNGAALKDPKGVWAVVVTSGKPKAGEFIKADAESECGPIEVFLLPTENARLIYTATSKARARAFIRSFNRGSKRKRLGVMAVVDNGLLEPTRAEKGGAL